MPGFLPVVEWGGFTLIGAILLLRGRALSVRYNAFTTRLRERHPNINPPPTPEWRARNTLIMTWMFRVFGTLLLLISIPALIGIFKSK
jgi:hypothetical protein